MSLPNEPIILLSFVNTKLRDNYSSLDQMCEDMDINKSELLEKLASVNYEYDSSLNKFVSAAK